MSKQDLKGLRYLNYFFRSKMQDETSPVQYALKMNGYIMRLDHLGFGMDHELSIDLILVGLPNSFA